MTRAKGVQCALQLSEKARKWLEAETRKQIVAVIEGGGYFPNTPEPPARSAVVARLVEAAASASEAEANR